MGEAAGAGADIGGDVAGGSAGKGGGGLGDFASSAFGGGGDVAAPIVAGGADAAGDIAGSVSPFVIDSPITAGSFDYLNAASGAGDAAGAGLITADASLNTGATPFAGGSTLPGSTAAGQPFAAGGTTAVSGASIDPAASGTALSAPTAGPAASSLAPAAPAAASGTPADATSSWADKLIGGASKSITNNPLGIGLGVAGLGYNILNGQKQTANTAALADAASKAGANNTRLTDAGIAQVGTNQANAADIGAKGKDLEQYLATGQLPLQYSQQVDQAINDAKTTAISNAAKNGQPTDPTKNTSLAQQLAQIDNQRAGMTSKIAETLFNAGAGLTNTAANVGNASASSLLSGGQSAAGLSGQLYSTLTGLDQKQAEQTAKAIAALAQSLNSGTPQKQAA